MIDERPVITPEAIREAKQNPGGWVYQITGDYGPDDAVPREAIVGAWKVDEDGNIVGEFIPNPNYRQSAGRQIDTPFNF